MAQKNELIREPVKSELVLTRLIAAPRALTFKAWTDPKHLAQWWGPKGFSAPVCRMDARPGGAIYIEMRGSDGVQFPIQGTVREVVAPERFVFVTTGFEDAQGVPQIEILNTVTFVEENGKTRLTLRVTVIRATPEMAESIAGMEEGWTQSLERFETVAPGLLAPVVCERTFNAPIDTVWKAITNVNDMKRWYFDIPEFKPEVGFVFEFEAGSPEKTYLHRCKVVEVVPGKKLSYSWEYPGNDGLSYVTFELFDENGKTKLKLTHEGVETFPSKDNADFAKSSFAQGWNEIINTMLKDFLEPAS
ncbi:MAG TPA: SRPBCC domain-containing protein [Chryseolinea sp.]